MGDHGPYSVNPISSIFRAMVTVSAPAISVSVEMISGLFWPRLENIAVLAGRKAFDSA